MNFRTITEHMNEVTEHIPVIDQSRLNDMKNDLSLLSVETDEVHSIKSFIIQ